MTKLANQTTIEKIFADLKMDEAFKKDIIIPQNEISVDRFSGKVKLHDEYFDLNDWSLSQFCSKLNGMAPKYYEACPPNLKAINANYWLEQADDSKLLFRTRNGGVDSDGNELGTVIRGMATERYAKFDDVELVDILMELLGKTGEFKDYVVQRYQRDDRGFNLRILTKDQLALGRRGVDGKDDTHFRGILIENSEVGRKSIRIKPLVWRQICSNGLMGWGFETKAKDSEGKANFFTRRHVGIGREELLEVVAEAMGKALKATDDVVEKLIQAKKIEMSEDQIKKTIERYSKEKKYNKKFVEEIKKSFDFEPEKNVFGLVQSFTHAVQRVYGSNEDMRIQVETEAGQLLQRLTA